MSVGESVLWGRLGSSERLVGFVTSKGGTTVNLTVIGDGLVGQRQPRGVRHISDPSLKTMIEAPDGVWEHTEFGRKVHELID